MRTPIGAKPENPCNLDLERREQIKGERIKNPFVKELLTPAEALEAISILAREVEIDSRINGG